MKTYGQDVTDLLVFSTDLVVDTDSPYLVAISSHIGHVSSLTPQDVVNLIKQLSEWVLSNPIGKEK